MIYSDNERKKYSIDLAVAALQSGAIQPGKTPEETAMELVRFTQTFGDNINTRQADKAE